jgi:hypothetical protein
MKVFKDTYAMGLVFLLILFSSCSGISIKSTYPDNQGYFAPLTDSVRQQAKDGYIQIDSSHAGNPLIQTVMVTVQPSFSQKVEITKQSGVFIWAIILAVVALALILVGIIHSSSGGKFTSVTVWVFVLAIAMVIGAYALIDWAHVKEIAMSKMQYDFLKSQPGDQLKQYVDQLLFK